MTAAYGEVPELPVGVRVERDVAAAVAVTPPVAEPHVVPIVRQYEPQ